MLSLQKSARRMLWKRRLPGVRFWNRLRFRREHPALEREVFGIHFRHPIGLAPVLERQVELLDVCDSIGFSFSGVIPGDMPVQTVAECLQGRKSAIVTAVELRADGPSEEEAMQLLASVSRGLNPAELTSNTHWSVVYNLTKKTATVCVARDFDNPLKYTLK